MKKSPVYYASLAMVVNALFVIAALTVLHPKNYGWVAIPVMSSVVFLAAVLGQYAPSMSDRTKGARS